MPGTGLGGGGSAGAVGPIVRTRNSAEQVPTNWARQYGSTVHNERYYYNSDFHGNTSAIISSGGNLIEQYRYSATGVPFGLARGDVNADGVVGTPGGGGGGTLAAFTAASNADYDQAVFLEKNKIYEVRADWNLDGVIDSTDTAVVSNMNGVTTGRKAMSAAGVGNFIDFEGRITHTVTIVSVLVLTAAEDASLDVYFDPPVELPDDQRLSCKNAQPPPQGPHYAICVKGSTGTCNKIYCPTDSQAPKPSGADAVLENCERQARREVYNSFLTCKQGRDSEGNTTCNPTPYFIDPTTGARPSPDKLEILNCSYYRQLMLCLIGKYNNYCLQRRGPRTSRYSEETCRALARIINNTCQEAKEQRKTKRRPGRPDILVPCPDIRCY
jgi:hypothetical protein